MAVQKTECDPWMMLEELRKENEDLRSEIAWRKNEAKVLRRSIGSGRVYHQLKRSLCCAEERNEALRQRVEGLENLTEPWPDAPVADPRLNRILQGLVEAGNAMQHRTWPECQCSTCASWKKVKDDLSCHVTSGDESFEEIRRMSVHEIVKVLKTSEL